MIDHEENHEPFGDREIDIPTAWGDTLYGLVEAIVQHNLIDREVFGTKLDLLEHLIEHVAEVNEGAEPISWCDDFVFIRRDNVVEGGQNVRTIEVAFCAATLSSTGGRAAGMYFAQTARPEESPLIEG